MESNEDDNDDEDDNNRSITQFEKNKLLFMKKRYPVSKDTNDGQQKRRKTILHKSNHEKKGRRYDYSVYKGEHPIISSQLNYYDLWYHRIKNFLDVKFWFAGKEEK